MLTLALDNPATYRRMLAIYGGDMADAFVLAVQKILRRHFAQNALPVPPDAALLAAARALWELGRRRGLPPALKTGEQGEPRELSESELAPLVEPIVSEFPIPEARAHLGLAVRDLARTLFQPEFKKCRLSYKECAPGAAACERQDVAAARLRISGAHCVDCPYWAQLSAEKNEKLLAKEWTGGGAAFSAQTTVFMPEDFRGLRHLLHLHARFGRR